MLNVIEWIEKYCEYPDKKDCSNCKQLLDGCKSWMHYVHTGDLSLSTRFKKNTAWMRVFKIKRTTDGLFKDKGMNQYFSERGNTWATKALVRSHIKMNDYHPDTYKDCIIVEYQLEEVGHEMIE